MQKSLFIRFVLNNVEHMQLFYDSKTILQEIVQGDEHSGKLEYVLVEESGPDHNKNYKVEARIGNKSYGCGEGHTKKAAEQEAAYQAILELRKKDSKSNKRRNVCILKSIEVHGFKSFCQ